MSYTALAEKLKRFGSKVQWVTVRQWLVEESHTIGPRDEDSLRCIGELTQDTKLLSHYHECFQACAIVRHYRRKILSLIATAIHDKLCNKKPVSGSEFEVVFENVDKLSDILELDNVFKLEETMMVNNAWVNRPISETEVLT